MDVCLMIEGQEDVTWEDWRALAGACEEHGVGTLFRSDHYLSVEDRRERGSLDAWGTISGLAAITDTLRLGTLVSPATFRHPAVLAKAVATADHISGGRVEVGIGAGWWDREHEAYGFPLPEMSKRLEALEEQMDLVRRHWGPGPFSFEGSHYRAKELDALPKPVQQPRPPLILGGKGGDRSLHLAARLADEYNTVFSTPQEMAEIRARLDRACEDEGRDPATLPLSLMTGWLVGADEADLKDRAQRLADWRQEGGDADELLAGVPDSWITGTVAEAVDHLRQLKEAGVKRVMAQHLLHRDLEAVQLIGSEVIPAVAR